MTTKVAHEWIDISVPVRDGMVHWPGDPEVTVGRMSDIADGDVCTVSTLSISAHVGTHMDAPKHFIQDGAGIDNMPFEATVGRARVIEITDPNIITVEELRKHRIRKGDRLLFKTQNSVNCWTTDEFVRHYVHISLSAARYLAERRVRSVGIDYLSVAGYNRDNQETHVALLSAGIWLIEGLNLSAAAPGVYYMMCLPLRLADADGAPARAAIRLIRAA